MKGEILTIENAKKIAEYDRLKKAVDGTIKYIEYIKGLDKSKRCQNNKQILVRYDIILKTLKGE